MKIRLTRASGEPIACPERPKLPDGMDYSERREYLTRVFGPAEMILEIDTLDALLLLLKQHDSLILHNTVDERPINVIIYDDYVE